MDYFIYILECQNGAFYTGYTTDIKRRYLEHCHGTAKCKFTRSFPPVRIAGLWKFHGIVSDALRIEKKVKSLTRQQKTNLIDEPHTLQTILGGRDQYQTLTPESVARYDNCNGKESI